MYRLNHFYIKCGFQNISFHTIKRNDNCSRIIVESFFPFIMNVNKNK